MITQTIFNNLVLIWIGIALILFPILLYITAPYGRHAKSGWGPMIDNRLGWFIMEFPALLIFVLFIITWGDFGNSLVISAFFLWMIHYFNRVYVFPLRIKTEGKKMPLIIMVFALFFNMVNSFLNGFWLSHLVSDFSTELFFNIRFLAGVFLFICGFIINQYHDNILVRLRKSSKNGYKIPYGGLFKYVSCPNFLGEIIEWGGFALLTWGLAPLSFFIWTCVNLVPRALDHHKWYKKKFEKYPEKRTALVPYIL